ncbi:MAG: hypothetical protein ACRDQU_01420 [Pseudonocardiaceae bacterium]
MAERSGNRHRGTGALAPDRLGAVALVFFVLGAAAPLASTAGGTSTGWAVTGVAGIPIAFLVYPRWRDPRPTPGVV